jgi:tRNA 2-thiocytidine biosynthesis protein TtcA
LTKLVGQAMIDHNMIKDGDKILIGLSGGKDSMTMLFLLDYFKKKGMIGNYH